MADTIAKGNVTISANADPMVAGLKKAEAKADGWMKGINQRMEAMGTGFGAALIGGGLAEVTKKLALGFIDMASNAEKLRVEMEKSEKFASKIAKVIDDRNAARDAELAGIEDPDKRLRETQAALDMARTEALGKENALNAARKELTVAEDVDMRKWSSWNPFQLLTGDKDWEMAKASVKESEDSLAKAVERRDKLQAELTRLSDPKVRAEYLFDNWAFGLKEAAKYAGMTANEIKLAKFAIDGVDKAKIKDLQLLLAPQPTLAASIQAAAIAANEINKMPSPPWLGAVIDSMAIIGSEVNSWKKFEEPWQAIDDKAASGPMFAAALEKGSTEAYSMDVANRFGFDTTDAAAEARRQTEEQKRTTRAIERLENTIDKHFRDIEVI